MEYTTKLQWKSSFRRCGKRKISVPKASKYATSDPNTIRKKSRKRFAFSQVAASLRSLRAALSALD